MPQATHYDAIVIGTSQGGRLLPIAEALAGRKVALIERGPVGGTCVNVGCTPTKTMVVSARVAYLVRRGAEYGVHSGPIAVDLEAIRQRKQGIVHSGSLNPYTIFIDPQLGRVGMSENEARKQGRNIRVAKLPMNAVPRALEIGETRGFMKAVVDAETQQILGCAMLCGGWRDYDHHPGSDDGQAALHRLKRRHLHPSNPGRRAQHAVYDARF